MTHRGCQKSRKIVVRVIRGRPLQSRFVRRKIEMRGIFLVWRNQTREIRNSCMQGRRFRRIQSHLTERLIFVAKLQARMKVPPGPKTTLPEPAWSSSVPHPDEKVKKRDQKMSMDENDKENESDQNKGPVKEKGGCWRRDSSLIRVSEDMQKSGSNIAKDKIESPDKGEWAGKGQENAPKTLHDVLPPLLKGLPYNHLGRVFDDPAIFGSVDETGGVRSRRWLSNSSLGPSPQRKRGK